MSDGSCTPPRRGIGSARRKLLAWTKYNLEQGVRWDDIPDPVPTCNFGAWVHRRKSLTKIEYTVYTGSFDLPIQTPFPVSFGSHSLGPTTYGYCKFFILNRAISCSLLGFSPESISGHTISGANWFSRAALQVEAASSSKYHQLRNYRGVNF
jgi:hypothetical protein